MTGTLLQPVSEFLGRPTGPEWLEAAVRCLPVLVIDHANCEKKAAATAMALINRYATRSALVERMSRLAREELRHFEQVVRLMRREDMPWRHVGASRYAAGLRAAASGGEPARLVDLLVIGAFIEARSCERFAMLAPLVGAPFGDLYRGLLASEARHFNQYLDLARRYAPGRGTEVEDRAARIRVVENDLISNPDTQLRFHSGPPA